MKRREVIRLIKAAGREGSARITVHAREEMENKNLHVAEPEILDALATAKTFNAQANGRWEVYNDEHLLHVIVLVSDGKVLVWTVY